MPLILNGNTIGSLYLGSAKIKEGYFGSNHVYTLGSGPVVSADTLRIQFSDGSYDPTASAWPDSSTWTDNGWVLTQVSASPNIWDFTHTANLPDDSLAALSSNGTNPPTAPYSVIAIDTTGWTNFCRMFAGHSYLSSCVLFDISTQTLDYMFDSCSSLSNDLDWAKQIATTRRCQNYGTFFSNHATPNAASIPTDFGGSKERTVIASWGWGGIVNTTTFGTYDIKPGDYIWIGARNGNVARTTRMGMYRQSGGTALDTLYGMDRTCQVTKRKQSTAADNVFFWGYPEETRDRVMMQSYTSSTSSSLGCQVHWHIDSFNFI